MQFDKFDDMPIHSSNVESAPQYPEIHCEKDMGVKTKYNNIKIKLQTTIIAIVYDGGVLCAADGRTTGGFYIANRVADKIWPIAKNIYALKSGTSSDSQFLVSVTKNYISQFAIEYGDIPPVKVAARILQQYQYQYKKYLSCSLILAGVDNLEGPCIYTVGMGGTTAKVNIAANGSGSTYVMGYLDKNYKQGMTRQEAKEFLKNAVTLAMFRDGSSGGIIRIVDIRKEGVTREYYSGNQIQFPVPSN